MAFQITIPLTGFWAASGSDLSILPTFHKLLFLDLIRNTVWINIVGLVFVFPAPIILRFVK